MVSRQAVWQKTRYAEDPEFRKKRLRVNEGWRVANKDKVEARRQERCYGISTDDLNALLARQRGVCGICKKKGRKLHVDHCHKTGKVRGLLCGKCNRGLGHYDDEPDRMRAAADYLEASLHDQIAAESSGVSDAGHQPAGAQLTLPFETRCLKPAPTKGSGRRSDRGRRERAGRGVAGRRNVASRLRRGNRHRRIRGAPGLKKAARARRQAKPAEQPGSAAQRKSTGIHKNLACHPTVIEPS